MQLLNSRIPNWLCQNTLLSRLVPFFFFSFFHTERKSYKLFYLMIFDLLEETCPLNPGGNSNFINLKVEKSKSYKSNMD